MLKSPFSMSLNVLFLAAERCRKSNNSLFFSCFLATKLNTEITRFSSCFKELAIDSNDLFTVIVKRISLKDSMSSLS